MTTEETKRNQLKDVDAETAKKLVEPGKVMLIPKEKCWNCGKDRHGEIPCRYSDLTNKIILGLIEEVEEIRRKVAERQGTSKYDSCYYDCITLLKSKLNK